MDGTHGLVRYASRILLYDPRGRVLLFLEEYPDRPGQAKWITPGGGAEHGETPHQTAVRELHEETGLAVSDLGDIVSSYDFAVNRPSARHAYAHWDFFVHAVDEPFEPSRRLWTPQEHATVKDAAWWSSTEVAELEHGYAPSDLPALIERFRPTPP